MIWELRHERKITLLLDIAKLSLSTYYYYIKHMKDGDKYSEIKKQIADIFKENKGRYGSRRVTMELHNKDYVINHKTVLRLMNEGKLKCEVRIKKYHSYKGESGKVAPDLLERGFSTKAPNEKWVTDVTEFADTRSSFKRYSQLHDQRQTGAVHGYEHGAAGTVGSVPRGRADPALRSGLAVPAQAIPEAA